MDTTRIAHKLLGAGISVIPVSMPTKTPAVRSWKTYQNRLPRVGELTYNGSLALVCGKVSGGVEVIDIDAKNFTGKGYLCKSVIAAIGKACPKLIKKLVIQETVSGGCHLIYRCREAGRNKVLAKNVSGRPLIETRANGGYIVAAPTKGYRLKQSSFEKVQTISDVERHKLLQVCQRFDESKDRLQKDNTRTNQSKAQKLAELNDYIQALGKKKDITSSYENWMKVMFGISHEFGEAGRETMHQLCGNYPKYSREECNRKFDDCLKQRQRKGNLITIASVYELITGKLTKAKIRELKSKHAEAVSDSDDPVVRKEKGGWEFNSDEKIARWMVKKGFRRFKNDNGFSWVHVDENNQCELLQPKHAASFLNDLLLKEFPEATELVNKNLVISFEVSALIQVISEFHRDTASEKFFYFKNCVVVVTKKGYRIIPWEKINKPVWRKNVKPHSFVDPGKKWKSNGLFADLVKNLQNPAIQTPDYFMKVLGYCVHNYKRADDDQIVVIMGNQQVKNSDNKGAGAGKTLLAQSFQHVSNQVFIPGDRIDFRDRFAFQNIEPDTENILIDDYVGKMTHLKTVATGDMKVEKKHQPSFTIQKERVPKIIITLPEVPDITDEGIRRRIYPIVISDHYYKMQQEGNLSPIVSVHGKRFFEEFNERDWNGFYRFLIDCCILYLKQRPDPKPVQRILFERLARQNSESDELIDALKKVPINKPLLIENYYEEFKEDEQSLASFAKAVRKNLRLLNYKISDHRVPVARKGTSPMPGRPDHRLWVVVKKGEEEKFGTAIKVLQKG